MMTYQVNDRFRDLEPGISVRWNGETHRVQTMNVNKAVIGGQIMNQQEINEMFASHDIPFEVA